MTEEVAAAYFEEHARADVKEIYRRVTVPTLVCVSPSQPARSAEIALASLVPDCRVAIAHNIEVPGAIFAFMGVDVAEVNPSVTPSADATDTAIILFADVVDSTAMSERLGDAAFHERARVLEQRVRAIIPRHAGVAVEGRTLGDGVLAVFSSAREAIAAAIECESAGEGLGLALHLGLHAGDVMRDGGNVYGIAVNIASRISDISAPNELLVSGAVREIARASAGVTFEDRGEHALKGIEDPVRVFAVRQN